MSRFEFLALGRTLRRGKRIGLLAPTLLLLFGCSMHPIQPLDQGQGQPSDVGEMVAYGRDEVLYIQAASLASPAIAVEDCGDGVCHVLYPKWSPDGDHLLYYREVRDDQQSSLDTIAIRFADRMGQVQTVAENIAFLRPADWSPTGEQVVYLMNTDRFDERATEGQVRILEVWTADVGENGMVSNAQQQGEVGFGEGCGGGGRSNSALVYEEEGGFAYGYLAAIVEWTPADILLFSNNCTSRTVGRFDLAAGQEIEPYEGELRGLTLDSRGERWVAIDGENHIVTGSPDALDYAPYAEVTIETDVAPELVFWGPVSGRLYFTTLAQTGELVDMYDATSQLETDQPLQPFFDTTQPTLYVVDPAQDRVTQFWQGEDYAYARITEMANGDVLVAVVENSAELLGALQAGTATADNLSQLMPTTNVVSVAADGSNAQLWLTNAQQFTVSGPPAAP